MDLDSTIHGLGQKRDPVARLLSFPVIRCFLLLKSTKFYYIPLITEY